MWIKTRLLDNCWLNTNTMIGMDINDKGILYSWTAEPDSTIYNISDKDNSSMDLNNILFALKWDWSYIDLSIETVKLIEYQRPY